MRKPAPTVRGAGPHAIGQAPPGTRRARETKSDQGQVVEILGFQAWETGDNRAAKADRQRFPTSAGLRSGRGQHISSLYVLIKSQARASRSTDDGARRPSLDVGKIARAMHDAADYQNVFAHYVVAVRAEAHALAELGTEPPSLWECDQSAAMFA
jgi:hypothetical protein